MKTTIKKFWICMAVLFLVVVTGGFSYAQGVKFRLKFKKDEVHRYEMNMKMKMKIVTPQGEMPTRTSMTMSLTTKTTDVSKDKESANIVTTVDTMTMKAKTSMMGNQMVVDMHMKPGHIKVVQNGMVLMDGPPPQAQLDICGKPIKTVVNRRGIVTKTKLPAGMGAMTKGMDLNNMSIPFPEKAINIGESWTHSRTIKTPLPKAVAQMGMQMPDIVLKSKYTYTGIEKIGGKKCYKIKVEASGESEKMKDNKPVVNRMKQVMTGFSYLDKDTCQLVKTEIDLTQEMVMSLMGQKMSINGSGKVVMEEAPKKPEVLDSREKKIE